jgi:hypothetical protein
MNIVARSASKVDWCELKSDHERGEMTTGMSRDVK